MADYTIIDLFIDLLWFRRHTGSSERPASPPISDRAGGHVAVT